MSVIKVALIQDGVVQNIQMYDEETSWIPPMYVIKKLSDESQVECGWLYDEVTDQFSPPPELPPQ